MEITEEFILAVERGVSAMIQRAGELEKLDEFKSASGLGTLLRKSQEQDLQTSDLLSGWAVRARTKLGIEPKK